jgi:hypothetical protein
MRRPAPFACLLGFALLAAAGASAQDTTEARLREALRETADKLHATEAELAQQQLATAAAEKERDTLKQAPRPSRTDMAQAAALQRRLTQTAGQLAQAQADGQKSQAQQQASAQAAQKAETARAALAEQLSQLRARDERCAANDEAVYGTGLEIAALYRDPGFVDHLRNLHLKPLGFDRVKEENRMRALEDRFNEEHAQALHCRTDPAPVTATPPTLPEQTEPSQPSTGGER